VDDLATFCAKMRSALDKKPDLSREVTECSEAFARGYLTPRKGTLDGRLACDRNRDGCIAFVLGAMALGTPEVLSQGPRRPAPLARGRGGMLRGTVEADRGLALVATYGITPEEHALPLAPVKLVIIHCAHDDLDGRTDAILSASRIRVPANGSTDEPSSGAGTTRPSSTRTLCSCRTSPQREGPIPHDSGARFVKLRGLVRERHLEHHSFVFDLVNRLLALAGSREASCRGDDPLGDDVEWTGF